MDPDDGELDLSRPKSEQARDFAFKVVVNASHSGFVERSHWAPIWLSDHWSGQVLAEYERICGPLSQTASNKDKKATKIKAGESESTAPCAPSWFRHRVPIQ